MIKLGLSLSLPLPFHISFIYMPLPLTIPLPRVAHLVRSIFPYHASICIPHIYGGMAIITRINGINGSYTNGWIFV